ncbi:MAG: benzoate-CoA ligase family protein [Gemmatimonadetes bacterium]|nr:benzoate-CoA ligase family protein [Gemmatimonadota bacterium]
MPDSPWIAPAGRYNAAADLIDRNLADRAERIAAIDPTRQLSYRDLHRSTNRWARALTALGVKPEQRVVMIMLDTVDFPTVFWGTIRAGAVAVPVNTLLSPDLWRYILDDSRAALLVISAECYQRAAPMLAELLRGRPLPIVISGRGPDHLPSLDDLLAGASADPIESATHADETAFWLYTSGSTGVPKAARHVHASPAHTARHYGQGILGLDAGDVVFSAAKLFFAYGLGNGMSFPYSVGATAILWPDRPSPEAVLRLMSQHRPTVFCGVPTLFAALLAEPSLGRGAGSARLRLAISAGEALPEEIGRRWQERVGVEVLDGIGSTELLHIFVSNRPGRVRYGSSGTPVDGYQARIADEQGGDVATGEIGELVIRGPTAADGYWNQRERSRRTFAGEWTHTGDKYRQDEEGFYYYCGRSDDLFKVSGIWVAPFEVESALMSHPAVLEAAVVGKEDADGLLKPKAFVVLMPGTGPSEELFDALRQHVKDAIGAWKYPRWIEALAELPKTATGKIQRYKLRHENRA